MLRTVTLIQPAHTPVNRTARELRIGGLTPFTSIDFPGRLSAVIYVQGCPLRCGYCHNPHLQQRGHASTTAMRWPLLLDWLKGRRGLIDAVVFSGGEPTVDPMLDSAIEQVRALGFTIGLHSAGTHPRRLKSVLAQLDWVGLDIKAPLDDSAAYDRITGSIGSARNAEACLQAVLECGIQYEIRTTAHPLWLDEAALRHLGNDLLKRGAKHWVVQIARSTEQQAAPPVANYPLPETCAQMQRAFDSFRIRSTQG